MKNKLGMGKVEYIAYKTMRFSLIILTIILISIFVILFIGLASALYAGESQVYPNDIGKDNLEWAIVDNVSEMIVMPLVTINSSNITITIPSNMPPNNFGIAFIEKITNTVSQTIQVQSSSSGHSSSRTKTVYKNNTEYIEVPTIEYINNETIVENKTTETKYKEIPTPTKWTWIFAGLFLLLVIIILIIAVRLANKESNSNENIENRKEENRK